jgi:hypothetical protein
MTQDTSSTGLRLLLIVLGFWVVMRAVNKDASHRTLVDYILGQGGGNPGTIPTETLTAGSIAPAGVAGLSPAVTPPAKLNRSGQANPVPGATGSRLDQGFDVTSTLFESPFPGTVVASEQNDPGWKGGGYVAIRSAANPREVVYEAEGLSPVVTLGQHVAAGQLVATPVSNPYNNIVGNAEIGLADPNTPTRPLAQVVRNPGQEVLGFYNWIRSLGGPLATSTSNAGHP